MDIDSIRKTEDANRGDRIHLFYDRAVGTWMTYGKSAYALRVCLKALGYDNICLFSTEYDLPMTVVDADSVKRIMPATAFAVWNEGEYAELEWKAVFDNDEYERWTASLKVEARHPAKTDGADVIDADMPNDGFIKDNMSPLGRAVKRSGDVVGAGVAMVAFSPLFLFCYVAIRMEDKGPAIYRQERIGRFGRPFYIYKFRSMYMNAERHGPQLSHSGGNHDSRLTRIGRFIRSHHLDELPQLWNVLIGDMSFIGPRPERKFFIDRIMEHDKRYSCLYQIRPGVTSYATLYNGYTDTIEKMLRRLEYDLYYLGHRSWLMDMRILARTFFAIAFGKKF